MSFTTKATRVDRDDYAIDHYADFLRDSHRTRLTFDLLNIAKRQHQCKEKLLSQAHTIRMKEHTRIENEFLRKLERNTQIANLSTIRRTLRDRHRQGSSPSPPPLTSRQSQPSEQHDKSAPKLSLSRPPSARTERINANIEKFIQTNTLLC
ncbi:unnamed protein product [Adineta ricciae]|uniref:Uncharacterized protein n=1 Tax=Adineta ricciae TaxID=249248 RepID=A0A813P8N8_ADIRI|nr:unnamed protein product [Adineta ricciae]CAF1073638.1 unnamed protein product [Adineta ricciae]